MKTVILIPTAGARKNVYWHDHQLPFFFTWPPCKWLYKRLGVTVEHLPKLKQETLARLAEGLAHWKFGDIVLVTGGYSPNRSFSSPFMMREWLCGNGVPTSAVIAESESVDTTGNMRESLRLLVELYGGRDEKIRIILITSHYHVVRTERNLRKLLRQMDLDWQVAPIKTYPPLTWECLTHEYAYNLLTEGVKRFVDRFPTLVRWYEARERLARNGE